MGKPSDLVQGTLDLLILKTVSLEPKHGWAIAKRIQRIFGRGASSAARFAVPSFARFGTKSLDQGQVEGNGDGQRSQVLFLDRRRTRAARERSRKLESVIRGDQSCGANDVGVRCHGVGSSILAAVTDFVSSRSNHSAIRRRNSIPS